MVHSQCRLFGYKQLENPKPEYRMSNKESRMMKLSQFFPSAFMIRYSIFCGSLLSLHAAREKLFRQGAENKKAQEVCPKLEWP